MPWPTKLQQDGNEQLQFMRDCHPGEELVACICCCMGFLMIGIRSGAPDTSSDLHTRAFGGLRFLLGRRTDPLVSMHDGCPLTSLRWKR